METHEIGPLSDDDTIGEYPVGLIGGVSTAVYQLSYGRKT